MAVAFHKILNQSLTWVTAHQNDELIGWINVAWDGFVHAFLVDRTAVNDELGALRRELVKQAVEAIRRNHPTVSKIHLDCREEEVAEFVPIGLQPLPGGIVRPKR